MAAAARRERWLGLLVLVGGVILTIAAARVTGPTFDEERRLVAVHRATELVRAVSDFGPRALASSSAQAIYDEIQPYGPVPAVVSGWFGEVLARAHLLDRLVAARLGWLLITGTVPGALYFLVLRSRGPGVAALASCVLFAMPRWVHAAAAAREPAIVASIWIVLLALYVRSIPKPLAARRRSGPSRFRGSAVAFAVTVGLGLSTSLATLWILPLVVAHALFTARATLGWSRVARALRQGMLPLPVGLLLMIVIAPVTLVAATPALWQGGSHAAEWLLSPLTPAVEPLLYRGAAVVSPRDVPPGYALHWIVATTPALVLALAFLGAGVMAAQVWQRRFSSHRDETALGALVLLGIVATVFGPAVTPTVLTRFPPRVEAALPFLAIAAAVAEAWVIARLPARMPHVHLLALAGGAVGFVAFGLVGVPTASASFGLFGGGTRRAAESRMWTIGDGSELAPLAGAIDRLGLPALTIDAPEAPRPFWTALERAGRLRTHVEPGRSTFGIAVTRGERPNAIATVSRDGAILWSLTK